MAQGHLVARRMFALTVEDGLRLDDERSRFDGPNKMDFYVPEASRFPKTRGYEGSATA
jgi:hypothetical protein